MECRGFVDSGIRLSALVGRGAHMGVDEEKGWDGPEECSLVAARLVKADIGALRNNIRGSRLI